MDAFNDPKASDHQKAGVAKNTSRYWRSIEDEVRKFFAEKWTAWEQEKPKFLTKAWIAKLHDDMLPERVLAERRGGIFLESVLFVLLLEKMRERVR